MTEPADPAIRADRDERPDPTEGASDPLRPAHRPWFRILTAAVLAVFVLATLVTALLV